MPATTYVGVCGMPVLWWDSAQADSLTYGELKLHPKWDDLRLLPLFDKVLATVAQLASID